MEDVKMIYVRSDDGDGWSEPGGPCRHCEHKILDEAYGWWCPEKCNKEDTNMITGIPDTDISFCPWCGGRIELWYGDGRCECGNCDATFYVIEDDESERRMEDE